MIKKLEKVKKIKTTGAYDKELWVWFSKYIRTRDAGICFTCGKNSEGKGYHAGHFIPVGTATGHALKYDERNVHGQCYHCNINLGGNGAVYYQKMIDRCGQKVVDELFEMKAHPVKWTSGDFIQKIIYYKNKVKYFF